IIDQAIGESGQLRYHSPILQAAVHGLFTALDGWHAVATHLSRLPDETARRQAETSLGRVPPELRFALDSGAPHRWLVEPLGLRRTCEQAVHSLLSLPARTPSLRLLSVHTAKVLAGILDVL